jgi:hypothetical protein
MNWYKSLDHVVKSIEAGEIPPEECLGSISPASLSMCVEIVKCRRELPMRNLVNKVLNGNIPE